MPNENRPVYKKHNSFVEIRQNQADAIARALGRISALRQKENLASKLSAAYRQILQQVYVDLLDADTKVEGPRFAISPSVADEIATYAEDKLPRYLVHRYRYEIFPQKKIVDEYPPYLQIEPSSICNFRCVFCFETDQTFTSKSGGFMGRMKLDMFKAIVDQAEGNVEFISLASRGEPLVCPDIIPMLEYTRGKFMNLKLNTNASLLDEAKCHAILSGGVKTVVFSADAAQEPLYSQLRVNGNLSVVLKNIERFQRIRQTQYADLPIITRVSGVKFSDDQDLDSMQQIWGGLVDQVAFVQYNPWENVYQQPASGVVEPCSDLWRRMFVWWDGKVNPCDVDYKSTLLVGEMKGGSLSSLWRSEAYERMRQGHQSGARGDFEPCRRCSVI